MNRSQLVREYHERRKGHNYDVSAQQLDLMFQIIKETLEQREKVTIHNLGTLSVIARDERVGRNPKTNEAITIPKRNGIKFKPSKSLIEAIQ